MNKWDTTSYIGITSNLIKRVWQHKEKFVDSFTKKYKLNKLVYYEIFTDPYNAISREKQLKKWSRKKKVLLIQTKNPKFDDLFKSLL